MYYISTSICDKDMFKLSCWYYNKSFFFINIFVFTFPSYNHEICCMVFVVNIDNTVGAVGFLPIVAGSFYPIILLKVDEETGEPLRGSDGFCIRCKPGMYCQ